VECISSHPIMMDCSSVRTWVCACRWAD